MKPAYPRQESFDGEGETPADASKIGIRSMEVGMGLLTTLAKLTEDAPAPMLKTLAAAADMAPAKVHRYMVSMIRTGYVEREPATGRYRLGPTARQIGISSIRRLDLVKVAGPMLPEICSNLKHSVGLAAWTYHGPVMMAAEDYRRHVTIGTRVGEVLPLLASATGRVFGAWMPRLAVEHLIERELAVAQQGGHNAGIRSMDQVEALFKATREAGVGRTEGGLIASINAMAAPLFDYRGVLVGVISVLGPAHELDLRPASPLVQALRDTAASISFKLGFQQC